MSSHPLDVDDIQGGVLSVYRLPYAAHLSTRIDDPNQAAPLLAALAAEITTEMGWRAGTGRHALNVALSYRGLAACRLPPEALARFPPEFRSGMAARAGLLGDAGASAPAHWEAGLDDVSTHVLLCVYAADRPLLDRRLTELRRRVARAGLSEVHLQRAGALPSGREHFGFVDGISQPAVTGSDLNPRGNGHPTFRHRWKLLAPGEFLLGYPDEDGQLPAAPAGPLGRNGTYLVIRKLYQDVARWRAFLAAAADRPDRADHVAAKILGRWPDGTPLVLSPERPDTSISADPRRTNDFRYASDRLGLACPLGAHIRRANPRDALARSGHLSRRHRIIRRSLPYGRPLPSNVDDGEDRGLLFACFNASIRRQFEMIQATWLRDGNVFGLGHDQDFLLGDPERAGKMTIQGRPPRFLGPQPHFVTLHGGGYFLLPGVAGLRAIADAAAAATGPRPAPR